MYIYNCIYYNTIICLYIESEGPGHKKRHTVNIQGDMLHSIINANGDTLGLGAVYVRWGLNTCPDGTALVYKGYAAGNRYNVGGGTSDYLCLTDSPTYLSSDTSSTAFSSLYGVEYEIFGGSDAVFRDLYNYEMSCALCHTTKSITFMLPGSAQCPDGWVTEYSGYLMAELKTSLGGGRTGKSAICVDAEAEAIGTSANTNPSVVYVMKADCTVLPCPPYDNQRALSCAICSQ